MLLRWETLKVYWASVQGADLSGLSNGILLGGYEATRFKSKAKLSVLETVKVHTSQSSADDSLSRGTSFAKGTLLARSVSQSFALYFKKKEKREKMVSSSYHLRSVTQDGLFNVSGFVG